MTIFQYLSIFLFMKFLSVRKFNIVSHRENSFTFLSLHWKKFMCLKFSRDMETSSPCGLALFHTWALPIMRLLMKFLWSRVTSLLMLLILRCSRSSAVSCQLNTFTAKNLSKKSWKICFKVVSALFDAMESTGKWWDVSHCKPLEIWASGRSRWKSRSWRSWMQGNIWKQFYSSDCSIFRCAEIDQASINGVTVTSASEFFDLTVGSIINSMLVGTRFEDHNKQEFLDIKNTMEESIGMFSPFDLTMPVWIMKSFFRKRYDFLVGAQESARVLVASEALKRYFLRCMSERLKWFLHQ